MPPGSETTESPPSGGRLEATADLLLRAQGGDQMASNRLFERFYPILKRIARGRLPYSQRDLQDTDDLVQNTLVQAFKRLEHFEYRREGAFLAYLRTILLNQIRQEVRRKRPKSEPVSDKHADTELTPERRAIENDTHERFDRALAELSDDQKEAVIMRIEFDYSYQEIADALRRPSANAARMLVKRALAKVARSMD